MIYKCLNCNGALEYNPAEDKMKCSHCGNDYFMWELDENAVEYHENVLSESEIEEEKRLDFTKEHTIYDEPEFMECKIYTCSSCGAELSVSDTEVSTYCAYCGQPTIIYNRVDKTRKPKYILPFKITKEEAENAIRQKFNNGLFVPSKIKSFEAERVVGIYLPYFLFDVYYQDKPSVLVGKSSFLVEADCEFVQVCQDASNIVKDELSYALEPYDLSELEDFNPGYLSGFYADKFDLAPHMLTDSVEIKCRKMFEDELTRRINKNEVNLLNKNNFSIFYSHPYFEIQKVEYAFLPVWFMTFQYKKKPYTMMVNGQTGKVVGTIPSRKAKAVGVYFALAIVITSLLFALGWGSYVLADLLPVSIAWIIIVCFIYIVYILLIIYGFKYMLNTIHKYRTFKRNVKLTRLKNTETFVKERLGKNP